MEQVTSRGFEHRNRGSGSFLSHPAFFVCALISLGLVLPVPSRAADESLEYQVKAAFLLNFTKFVEWPPAAFDAPDSPIVICILGDDPFGSILDQIVTGEVVDGRKVTVQRMKRAPAPKTCQVLFVNESGRIAMNILASSGPGVLTVGEGEGFIREGGMIAFVLENRRVRFEANQAVAEGGGLKLSSKLLNVARTVKK